MSQKKRKRNKQNQSGPPTLADIVRQETGDGRVIVKFYRDVIQGKRDDEGFEACHKMEAAMQVHAVAPEVVEDAITRLTGIECHTERRGERPKQPNRSSSEESTPDSDLLTTAARRHDALEYLAEALAAPSLRDDPRVTGIVRKSTDHGRTTVSFLIHVMHGVVRGFRPRNRMEAARELIGHIARDELRRSGALTPSPSTEEHRGKVDSPAKAGTQNDPTVVPAKAGTQRGGDREGLPSNSAPTKPAKSASEGTRTVRPEPVEGPVEGQCSSKATVPEADTDEPEHRGVYDIHGRMAEARWDPSHPIHKFIEAYEEVAATFHREDEENDNDESVRKWISGEIPDTLGKYISDYGPGKPPSLPAAQAQPPAPATLFSKGRERLH